MVHKMQRMALSTNQLLPVKPVPGKPSPLPAEPNSIAAVPGNDEAEGDNASLYASPIYIASQYIKI